MIVRKSEADLFGTELSLTVIVMKSIPRAVYEWVVWFCPVCTDPSPKLQMYVYGGDPP